MKIKITSEWIFEAADENEAQRACAIAQEHTEQANGEMGAILNTTKWKKTRERKKNKIV